MAEEPTKAPLVITITGHRPDKLGGYETPNPMYSLVVKGLADAFEKLKPDYVITGMGLGVDQWGAEIALNMSIPYVAAVPFDGQDSKWPPRSKAKYAWLISRAYQKYVICPGEYAAWKMQRRNEWMVNSCNLVVAVWNGTPGGTYNCVTYAAAQGKPIEYIPLPPAGMEVDEFYEKLVQGKPNEPKTTDQPSKPGTKRIVEI